MERLDLLADQAVADPVAGPTPFGELHDRVRDHERRARNLRVVIGSAVMLPLLIVGGLLALRSPAERTDATAPATATVDTVFGAAMAGDGAVWPSEPMPLAELLDTVGTEVLGWPSVQWDESDLGESEGGVTGTQPGRTDRRVAMQLRAAESGRWQITSFYPSMRMQLEDGYLAGFALDIPADTAQVEVFRRDPIAATQSRTVISENVAGAAEVRLETPVVAERAGSFLLVARDASGEATAVSGLSIGLPDRLTIAIDRLLDAGAPTALPGGATAIAGDGTKAPLDRDRSVVLADLGDGFDLYIVPFADNSGVLLIEVSADRTSRSTSGADALEFNGSGLVTSQFDRSEADGHTLVVLPDSIEFSPELQAESIADGRVAVLPYIEDLERFEVIDGVMTLRP